MPQVTDKNNEPIHEGEEVSGKIKGGRHVGQVQSVITTENEANESGVKNPPKVVIEDQHGKFKYFLVFYTCLTHMKGHIVNRNPESLVHGDVSKH